MKIKKLFDNISYTFLTSILMIYIITDAVNSFLEFKISSFIVLSFVLIESIVLKLIITYRKKLAMYISVACAVIISVIVVFICNIPVNEYLSRFFEWASSDLTNGEVRHKSFFITLIFFLSVVTTVFAFILQRKFISRLIIAVLIAILTFVMALVNISISKMQIFCTVAYIFFVLIERAFINKVPDEDKKREQAISLRLLPMVVLFAFCISVLPSKNSPIQWTFFKKAYSNACVSINNMITDFQINFMGREEYYSLKMVGYGSDGKLGGNVDTGSNSRALVIDTDYYTKQPLYINGTILNKYDKNNWTTNQKSVSKQMDTAIDCDELLYAFNRSKNIDVQNLFQYRDIKINFNGIHTKTMFFPAKTVQINTKEKYQAVGDELHFNKTRGYPTDYDLTFYEINYSSPEFIELVTTQAGYKYNEKNNGKYTETKKLLQITKNPEGILKERRDKIYSQNLNVPDCISDRVKELATALTKDCDNDYQKLKRIESFLSTEYQYTLTPGKIPKDKELVDYFLFESKKGYCSYFATSMAILGRCAGIPTRYVQGFMCDAGSYDPKTYYADNNCAHAWVEAYIEGVGWIPFEPTASYTDKRYPVVTNSNDNPEETENDDSSITNQDDITDIINSHSKDTNSDAILYIVLIVIGALILMLIILIISSYLVVMKRFKNKYSKGDGNDKYMLMFRYMLKLLELNGYSKSSSETIRQFALRVSKEYNTKEMNIEKISKDFMKLRYGDYELSESQINYIGSFCDELIKERQNEIGKFRFRIKDYFIKNKL